MRPGENRRLFIEFYIITYLSDVLKYNEGINYCSPVPLCLTAWGVFSQGTTYN